MMESLLRWGIQNSSVDNGPRPTPELLDPGIIDAILGKPDAVLMKEALAIGMDDRLNTDVRVTALDNLEMLVEQIDNATNLTPLQMYPKILSLLSPQTPDQVRFQALWILGTAVQNNPKAQADFLMHDPLPTILSILSPSTTLMSRTEDAPSCQTRSKAAYALSASLKHNAAAVIRFGDVGGWDVLRDALQDSDITIRRKSAFLINTLLLPTAPSVSSSIPTNSGSLDRTIQSAPLPTSIPSSSAITPNSEAASPSAAVAEPTATPQLALEALRTHRIIPILIGSLATPLPHGPDADEDLDPDYAEKAARALIAYLEIGGEFSSSEQNQLWTVVVNGEAATRDAWGVSERDWEVLKRAVSGT